MEKHRQRKSEITTVIRASKKLYYNEYFSQNSNNMQKFWAGINQIINNKPKPSDSGPTCIEIDVEGNIQTIVDPYEIANKFNSHYTSIADKILNKQKYAGNKQFHSYLQNPNSKTFMIKPTTPAEIEDIIIQINTSKSTGPNSIPNFLIKSIKKSISIPLSILFNKSFTSGKCPDILKLSKVIPIYKKD